MRKTFLEPEMDHPPAWWTKGARSIYLEQRILLQHLLLMMAVLKEILEAARILMSGGQKLHN